MFPLADSSLQAWYHGAHFTIPRASGGRRWHPGQSPVPSWELCESGIDLVPLGEGKPRDALATDLGRGEISAAYQRFWVTNESLVPTGAEAARVQDEWVAVLDLCGPSTFPVFRPKSKLFLCVCVRECSAVLSAERYGCQPGPGADWGCEDKEKLSRCISLSPKELSLFTLLCWPLKGSSWLMNHSPDLL